MTSSERNSSTPRGGGSIDITRGGSIANTVAGAARRRPPPPKGRGVAMVVIAAAVLVAVVIQVYVPIGGPTELERRADEAQRSERLPAPGPAESPEPPTRLAPRRPAEEPSTPARAVEPPSEWPVAMPGADVELPDGLGEATASDLRINLGALRQSRLFAESALRDLPGVVAKAPEAERDLARRVVAERLASLVRNGRMVEPALDAAIALCEAEGGAWLAPLARAVRTKALTNDDAVPAALVFLDVAGSDVQGASAQAVLDVVQDRDRPLHLRILAARSLGAWGKAADERALLAEGAETPEALRRALGTK